ncbi:MAG: VWA domain-containing protein [Gammaproteobacteria bacterium]
MQRLKRLAFTLIGTILISLSTFAQDGEADSPLQDIVLVLDNSGSMRKNDPGFLTKVAVKEFVQQSAATVSVAVMVFDSDARLVAPLAPLSKTQSQAVLKSLDQIDYRGQLTHIPAAMERAIYELKLHSRPGAAKSIILLTDGIVDTGNPASDAEATQWLREKLATEAARHRIKFFGIALTDEADFQLLQSLAIATDGDYFRARQAAEIAPIFERIGRVMSPLEPTEHSQHPEFNIDLSQEMPAFVTVEVMGESRPADAAESLAAIRPPDLASATPAFEPKTVPSASATHQRLAWAGALAGLVAIVVATGMFAWRKRIPTNSPSTESKPAIAAEAIPRAYLHDTAETKRYPLSRSITVIGRVAPDPVENADSILIRDAAISRRHALVEYKHHSFWVIDQKSGNGTFVNGQRITEQVRLRHGDRIRFHKTEFEFELAASSAANETCLVGTGAAQKIP